MVKDSRAIMNNYTIVKVEQAAAEAVVSREKKFKSSSIFLVQDWSTQIR